MTNKPNFIDIEQWTDPRKAMPPEGVTVMIRTKDALYSTCRAIKGRGFIVLKEVGYAGPDDSYPFEKRCDLIPTSQVISWQEAFRESFIYFVVQTTKETE